MTGTDVYNAMRADADRRTFNMAGLIRAASFQATHGEPMTIRRAKALNAVLGQCELIHFPGRMARRFQHRQARS